MVVGGRLQIISTIQLFLFGMYIFFFSGVHHQIKDECIGFTLLTIYFCVIYSVLDWMDTYTETIVIHKFRT